MEPPSTPAPLGVRWFSSDPEEQPPPTSRDPMAELHAIEAYLREAAPSDPGPMSMRGEELAIALEHAVSSRVRVKH